jgi:hypothetical protein
LSPWGTAIFSDDFAADLRGEYRDLIGRGVSGPDATRQLVEEYQPDADPDDWEGPVFWLALAATQWTLGRLENMVKARALEVVDLGLDLRRWERDSPARDVKKRRAALAALKTQLLLPPSPPKRVLERYLQTTEFEVGDVLTYRRASGQPALLRVAEHHVDKGGTMPTFEVVDWTGHDVPSLTAIARLGPKRPSGSVLNTRATTRFMVARRSKRDGPTDRLQLIGRQPAAPPALPRRTATLNDWLQHPDGGIALIWWNQLDNWLSEGFGLD